MFVDRPHRIASDFGRGSTTAIGLLPVHADSGVARRPVSIAEIAGLAICVRTTDGKNDASGRAAIANQARGRGSPE
jgi:hypothetical protein